jgi:hypothetical protein
MNRQYRVALETEAGTWVITSKKPIRFWLLRLVLEVVRHRFWHLWHDGAWID